MRHRGVVVTMALCLVAISVASMRGLRFDTDVLSLLPRDGRVIPAFRTYIETFGSLDQLYVVLTAPPGHAIADYEAEIDLWIQGLRAAPEIARVDTGLVDESRDLSWLADRGLLLLDERALDVALERLAGTAMRPVLASRRELLALPSPVVADLVRHDPLGILDLLRDQLGSVQAGVNLGVTEGGYTTTDGRSRLLVALPSRPPFDADFSRALLQRISLLRSDASRSPNAPDSDEIRPPLDVEVAGGHRIAVETEAVVRRESILTTVGSLALVLPLLYVVFRSLWLVGVGSIPSAASLVVVLGLLGLIGTTLSTAATASAAMVFGLGVDGVVLLYVGYTLAVSEGAEPAAAIHSLGGPASSMLLGMWTTAATFYGLLFVDFPSLEQLGALVGHSMVLCGVLTLLIVPALLPRSRRAHPVRSLSMPRFASWVERRRLVILAAATVITVLFAASAIRLRINPTLDRLRSVTPGAELLQAIGPRFGLPEDVYVILAEGSSLPDLLVSNQRLHERVASALPGVAVQSPSALLPSEDTQAQRLSTVRKAGLSPASVGDALARAAEAEGFRPGSFDPFRERLPHLLSPDNRLTYEGFVDHGLGDLIGRFIARKSDHWMLVTYAFPSRAADVATLQRVVAEASETATLTGVPLVNRELADRFLPQFVKGLAIGTAVVLALVLAAFRDWRLSLLSLTPTAIGIVWGAGALALTGVELDLFALFAMVTFVGIGVDYGIHMVHRYRERGQARKAIEELAPVILVAAAITLLGYGTLITSSYPPLRSIGLVSAVGIVTLATASLFVLPALLARPVRAKP